MAQPFTTGAAHLFIGVPFAIAELVSVPAPRQRTLTGGMYDPYSPDYVGGAPPIVGGRIESTPNPPPPQYTLSILQGRVPVYLGTCKQTPSVKRQPFYLPWHEDGMGCSGSADELYEGEEHLVLAPDINRLNEPLVAFAQNAVAAVTGGRRGVDLPGAIGTSMTWEGATFPLWVQFPHAAKLVGIAGGLVAGYRYYQAKLVAPDVLSSLGLEPMERTLAFHCGRYLDLLSGTSGTYDHNMQGLPVIT